MTRCKGPFLQPRERSLSEEEDGAPEEVVPCARFEMWFEYREAHPDGYQYSRFCDRYREWRGRLEWTPSRLVRWARRTGPETAAFARTLLESRPHPEQGYRSCLGLMRLARAYPAERVEAACRRALDIGAHSYKSVKTTLANRSLDRSLILRLASGQWIRDGQTVLVTGATGSGKSYLACAFGHQACRLGISTRYYRVSRLLDALALARADGSYAKLVQRLARTWLLVLDDWGLASLSGQGRHDLLEVLDDRCARRGTILASQLPVEHWHDVVGDPPSETPSSTAYSTTPTASPSRAAP